MKQVKNIKLKQLATLSVLGTAMALPLASYAEDAVPEGTTVKTIALTTTQTTLRDSSGQIVNADSVGTTTPTVAQHVEQKAEGAYQSSKDAVGNAVDVTKEKTVSAYDATKDAAAKTYDAAKDKTESAVDSTKKAAGKAYDATKETTENAVDVTKEKTSAAYHAVKDKTKSVAHKVATSTKKAAHAVGKKVVEAKDAVKDALTPDAKPADTK